MAKLTLKTTPDQLNKLYNVLSIGTPLTVALASVGISTSTYYYWVAIYSIVVYVKEQRELEEIEKLSQAGVSIQEIKDMTTSTLGTRKGGIASYIEPKQESILQYKNNARFRKYANEIYEIVNKCNVIRSDVVVKHLNIIAKSTDAKTKVKASGSMWFLERTQPDLFGRAVDKVAAEEENSTVTPVTSVQVEFIDPNTDTTKDRVREMEDLVVKQLKGSGEA